MDNYCDVLNLRRRTLYTPSCVHREVLKLVAAAEALVAAGYFNKAERAQIHEVYYVLGVVRNEMQTDDNFVFSKVGR